MTKRILFSLFLSLLATSAFARRKHAAHEHGVLKLGIEVAGSNMVVTLDSPADSIVGTEVEAKTDAEKKQQADAFAKLSNNIGAILGLPKDLDCKVTESDVDKAGEGEHGHHDEHAKEDTGHKHKESSKHDDDHHSDVRAKFKIACAKPLSGHALSLNFKPHFDRVKKVNLTLIPPNIKQKPVINASDFPAAIQL